MEYLFTAYLKKKISFLRMPSKDVIGYEVYEKIGTETKLIDTIENPVFPTPILKRIHFSYNENITWNVPEDIYLDRDHPIQMYLNGFIVNPIYYDYNRISKLITINKNLVTVNRNDIIELEYFSDIIIKEYMVENDCEIMIKPIFNDNCQFGTHNIII